METLLPDRISIDQLSARIGEALCGAFDDVRQLPEATWSLARGSARVFVSSKKFGTRLFVQVRCPLVAGATASLELFEHLATHADDYLFGHLSCERTDEDEVDVFLTHVLSTVDLQARELLECVAALLLKADEIDDQLARDFGGQVFR